MSNVKCQLNNAIIALLILLLWGCGVLYSKDDYINDFKNFIDSVEKDCRGYTDSDWVEKDKIYEKYAVVYYEKYKNELTENDKYAIGKIKGMYSVIRLKRDAQSVLDQTKDVLDQTKGFIDGSIEKLRE